MSGLNYGAMYKSMIDIGSSELIDYQNSIENYLHEEKYKLDTKFEEIKDLAESNEEYYYVKIDSLTEEYQNYDKFYTNNFRGSVIVQSYTFLEYYLKRICDHVNQINNFKFELKDLKGHSDIDRAKIYLTKTTNVNFGNLNPEWAFINKVRHLRNSIAHSAGEFEYSESNLTNFIKEHNSLTVKINEDDFKANVQKTYQVVINDEQLNLEFIENIKIFFTKLINEIFH